MISTRFGMDRLRKLILPRKDRPSFLFLLKARKYRPQHRGKPPGQELRATPFLFGMVALTGLMGLVSLKKIYIKKTDERCIGLKLDECR